MKVTLLKHFALQVRIMISILTISPSTKCYALFLDLFRPSFSSAASGGQTVLANDRNGGRLRLIASRHDDEL